MQCNAMAADNIFLANCTCRNSCLRGRIQAERHPCLKVIVHVDMDMFYAAVEMRDQPELADKPMAVGGMGMLSTSNYKVLQSAIFTVSQ